MYTHICVYMFVWDVFILSLNSCEYNLRVSETKLFFLTTLKSTTSSTQQFLPVWSVVSRLALETSDFGKPNNNLSFVHMTVIYIYIYKK